MKHFMILLGRPFQFYNYHGNWYQPRSVTYTYKLKYLEPSTWQYHTIIMPNIRPSSFLRSLTESRNVSWSLRAIPLFTSGNLHFEMFFYDWHLADVFASKTRKISTNCSCLTLCLSTDVLVEVLAEIASAAPNTPFYYYDINFCTGVYSK